MFVMARESPLTGDCYDLSHVDHSDTAGQGHGRRRMTTEGTITANEYEYEYDKW